MEFEILPVLVLGIWDILSAYLLPIFQALDTQLRQPLKDFLNFSKTMNVRYANYYHHNVLIIMSNPLSFSRFYGYGRYWPNEIAYFLSTLIIGCSVNFTFFRVHFRMKINVFKLIECTTVYESLHFYLKKNDQKCIFVWMHLFIIKMKKMHFVD